MKFRLPRNKKKKYKLDLAIREIKSFEEMANLSSEFPLNIIV